jgi:hypothetical protein
MLHACFTPIALCFVYTSWHFYAFSGTNLLTRCHSVSSYFLLFFLFQVFTEGNILGIGRNKSQSSYFSDTKTESKGETETSQEPATPSGGAPPLWPHHPMVWAPRAPTNLALLPINSHIRENPKGPSLHPQKVL